MESRLLALKLVLKIIYLYFHNQQTKKNRNIKLNWFYLILVLYTRLEYNIYYTSITSQIYPMVYF